MEKCHEKQDQGSKPVTNFTTERSSNLSWSDDGKKLAVIRDTSVTDAVLISPE